MRARLIASSLLAFLLTAGCASEKPKIRLILRHNAPPEQPQHRALLRVAEVLNERTGGRIRLEVYPLITVPEQPEKLRAGLDELAMVSMGGMSEYYPPLAAFEAPYMFRDLDHFYRTVQSPIGQRMIAEFERRAGLHIIDVWHQGVREVTLRDRPATTPEEFGHIKLRVPPNIMFVEAARVLGALPTTMAFSNVYLALRAGIVDGQENPLPTIRAMRFNEVCKYLVLTDHMIGTIMPIISTRQWQRFSPEDRRIITEAFREGGRYNRQIIEEEERRLVEAFARRGMIVLRPDLRIFRRRAEASWRRFQELWGDSLVMEIQAVE